MVTATIETPLIGKINMKICHHCRIKKSLQSLNIWDSELDSLYNQQPCDK